MRGENRLSDDVIRMAKEDEKKKLATVHFGELPKDLQDKLLEEPGENGKRPRSEALGLKEKKVKAVGKVLNILSPFTLPQQRTILKFTIETLETANKRWSNDTLRHPDRSKNNGKNRKET